MVSIQNNKMVSSCLISNPIKLSGYPDFLKENNLNLKGYY